MLFWIATIIIILLCYFVSKRYDNSKKVFLISTGICLVVFLGSRYCANGFTDEVMYNYQYEVFVKMNFSEFIIEFKDVRDKGFYFLYWLMARVIPWLQFPIYFITAFFIFTTFRFIYKNTDEPLIAVLLVFVIPGFGFYMAAYRQCFATCFCLLAFERAKEKKIIRYLILMVIAISMHASAIAFLPVYFLVKLKPNKLGVIIWVIGLVALWSVETILITYFGELFENDYTEQMEFSLLGYFIQIIIMLIPFILDFFGISSYEEGEKDSRFIFWVLLSVGLIFFISKYIAFSFERVSYYYSLFAIIALPNSIKRVQSISSDDNALWLLVCAVAIALMLFRAPSSIDFFFNYV